MRSLVLPLLLLAVHLYGQEPCDVTISETPITCPGDDDGSLTVTGSAGSYTYYWDHDPGITGATAEDLAPGIYVVTVLGPMGCASVLEHVLEDPIVPALGSMQVTNISCAGNTDGSVTFSLAPGLNNSWQWWHDASETNTTLSDLGVGDYGVVIPDDPNCPSYVWATLGDPDVEISGEELYCPSSPPLLTTQLLYGLQPHLYTWSTGGTGPSFQVEPGTTGTIQVVATDTTSGCVASGEIILAERPAPYVQFVTPDSICQFLDFTVYTTGTDADSLVWRWSGDSFSNEWHPEVRFDEPYWQPISLQGFDPEGCGNVPVQDSIYVNPLKPALFTAAQIPCTPMIEVVLQSTADTCAFLVGDSVMTTHCGGTFQFDLRRYRVHDVIFHSMQDNGCNDTEMMLLDVRTEPTLFLPTAFTPDGDGVNDVWPGPVDIPEDGFELKLFDRSGSTLWESRDPMEKWEGAGLPSGVYVYTMHMRDPCDPVREVAKQGIVTLLR